MISRLHLSTILAAAVGLWGLMLLSQGVTVSAIMLRPFSAVVGALVLLLLAFDLWAWRLRLLQGWFVPRPDVRGTWRVELQSDWKKPETGEVAAPIVGFLVIRQTFSMISVRLLTAESSSELVGAEIAKAADGTYRISGIYRNEPKLSVRDRSPIHYGALLLDVEGEPVERLAGHYWTDRDTRGQIVSTAHRRDVLANFESASKAFSASSGAEAAPEPEVGT
jgi:hypothetical protein